MCSGGDGTLNEVISGMMELTKPVALGYIPAGSTNDFASSLKLPKQMMPAALNAVNGIPRAVDIGRFCEDSYFAYVAGFGAFTEVSYMTPQDKKNLLGHQAYILEGVKSLASIKSYVHEGYLSGRNHRRRVYLWHGDQHRQCGWV
ncbi:MAG: diacylglycerol/lipid kinase family protein [Clostridium sp.]